MASGWDFPVRTNDVGYSGAGDLVLEPRTGELCVSK